MTRTRRNFIANLKLHPKIISIVLIALSILVFIAFWGLSIVNASYDRMLRSALADSLSPLVREVEANLTAVEVASTFLISDQSFQDSLETFANTRSPVEHNTSRQDLYTASRTVASLNSYITAMALLGQNNTKLTALVNPMVIDETLYQHISTLAREKLGQVIWYDPPGIEGGLICARSVRKIRNLDLQEIGTLIIHVDLEKIIRDSQAAVAGSQSFSIAIQADGETIFPREQNNRISLLPSDSEYGVQLVGDEEYFVVQKTSEAFGWVYLGLSPYKEVFQSILSVRLIFVFALLLAIGLSIWSSNRLTRNVIRHFDKLKQKMESFGRGDLNPVDVQYDYSQRKDELGVLHRNYDYMLESITDLIEDNYVKQLLIKDSQIKTLEHQINPHFLYNTLNSIHWQAVTANQPEISVMVQALAGMLRASLSEQTDTVPLVKELEIIENYLKIQKIRFVERLDYTQEIDEALLMTPVPKMCLQPIIENAIQYSLEEVAETCSIRLRIFKEDCLLIEISNSGSQIDEDILKKISTNQLSARGQGIGLANIDARAKLLFGQNYGLQFTNQNARAVVTLRLPLQDGD